MTNTDESYKPGDKDYAMLKEYSDIRRKELSAMFSSLIEITDKYGSLICRVTRILSSTPPKSVQDTVVRDLMADVFDFLWEWRRPLLEGRDQVAYPLARRVYESLSLLSICAQDQSFAYRWEKGKQISNAEIRKALANAPMSESEEDLKDIYKFFSLGAHPNRDLIPYRSLGEGNQFVLGSIGRPDLIFVTDHCNKLVKMWFWFTAAVSHFFLATIQTVDSSYGNDYLNTAKEANKVINWLSDNFNRLLEERQEIQPN